MLEIISSGKNTQLHTFPTLTTKCTYSHVGNEDVDFQLFSGTNIFFEVNRKSGFELLRTQCRNGADNIQRIKKRQLDDLYCAATSKVDIRDVALGLSTGFIKFFNINTGEFMPNKFAPDKIGNSVTYLDYSSCNEYLASLYNNGDINVYGLKTGIKLETLKVGNHSTLFRFNPTKKFNLAIASYSGAISVFDIQTKRKIFYDTGAHKDICKDLSMSPALPDILLTAGYDCIINVFDVRQRHIAVHMEHIHPFSTIALSNCGQYCCAGNLKGDIITYDFRNFKEALDLKRAHTSAVIRVGFVPPYEEKREYISIENDTFKSQTDNKQQQQQQHTSTIKNISENKDSFNEFLDFCEIVPQTTTKQNNRQSGFDSFSELLEPRKHSDFSTEFNENRLSLSLDAGLRPELRLKRKTLSKSIFERQNLIVNNSPDRIIQSDENEKDKIMIPTSDTIESKPPVDTINNTSNEKIPTNITKRKRKDLNKIIEEISSNSSNNTESNSNSDIINIPVLQTQQPLLPPKINILNSNNVYNISPISPISPITSKKQSAYNKENQQNFSDKNNNDGFVKFINDVDTSTPNQNKPIPDNMIIVDKSITQQLCEQMNKLLLKQNEFEQKFESILYKINRTENEIKYYLDTYHHQAFNNNYGLWFKQQKEIADMKSALLILMRDDSFVQEYLNIKAENEELKKQLSK